MNKKKSILTLFLVFQILIFNSMQVFAAAPVEHCFGYNGPELKDSTGSLAATAINTVPDIADIHTGIDAHGYYNPYYFINNSAPSVLNSIGKDSIFYISGHGNAGLELTPYYDAYGNWTYDCFAASGYLKTINEYYKNTTNKLRYVKLAFFNSCYSALTHSNYGNLIYTATNLGADAAIGFSSTVDVDASAYFAKRIITYYGMDSNNEISACAASAKRDTLSHYYWLTYKGVDSYVISKSTSTVKLAPASYGVY